MEDSEGMEDIEEYEMGEGGKDGHLIWIGMEVSMLEVDHKMVFCYWHNPHLISNAQIIIVS